MTAPLNPTGASAEVSGVVVAMPVQLSRAELMDQPCWSCWWREGGCYSEKLGEIGKYAKGEGPWEGARKGHVITIDLIARCTSAQAYFSKRKAMAPLIDACVEMKIPFVIQSEENKARVKAGAE